MSVPKLFTDDTSLFSVVHDHKTTVLSLNENLLKKVSRLINGTRCLIQIPRSKLKKLFSRKKSMTTHGTIFLNNLPIVKNTQK